MKTLKSIAIVALLSLLLYSCNKNEFAPEVVDQEFSIEENSPKGTIIGIVEASDRDEDQILAYQIVDGNAEEVVEMDASNGAIRVKEASKLDYESHRELMLTIVVSDEHNKEPLESSAKVRITLLDENEFSPDLEPQIFTLDENPIQGQEIGKVIASDPESHQKISYHISDEMGNPFIQIDSASGLLTVLDTAFFDYELNQSFNIIVAVSDDHKTPLTSSAEITIQLNNVIEIHHYSISLQPDGEKGKDALFGKIVPDNNYGSSENIHLYAWTQSGAVNVNRAAVEFDLSEIPAEATIDSASLSLYFNSTSAYGDQHEGETAFTIQRITTAWDESSITWRTQPAASSINQVYVDGAISPTQNFAGIDLKQLIGDYILDAENSHGFLLRFQDESPYKVALLASSDHPLAHLRPKLEIHYTVLQ